tara:strand:+ start:1335 stop:1676 length:342 start_codon:yes stop_codon:yes gene_type:complete
MAPSSQTDFMSTEPARFEGLLHRVRVDYLETPSLRLTLAQAQRLWDLDRNACAVVLNALIDEHFLRCATNGQYFRAEPSRVIFQFRSRDSTCQYVAHLALWSHFENHGELRSG